jgi:hypothetical protein
MRLPLNSKRWRQPLLPAIPNPENGYIPRVGEIVKIVGGCHPRILNQFAYVTEVNDDWHEVELEEGSLTGGRSGGLEKADPEEVRASGSRFADRLK